MMKMTMTCQDSCLVDYKDELKDEAIAPMMCVVLVLMKEEGRQA